jgi:hypothetical protein
VAAEYIIPEALRAISELTAIPVAVVVLKLDEIALVARVRGKLNVKGFSYTVPAPVVYTPFVTVPAFPVMLAFIEVVDTA